MDPYGWAKLWGEYVNDRNKNGEFNYRQENLSGCGPEIELKIVRIHTSNGTIGLVYFVPCLYSFVS
jgi:hypothetical protein